MERTVENLYIGSNGTALHNVLVNLCKNWWALNKVCSLVNIIQYATFWF